MKRLALQLIPALLAVIVAAAGIGAGLERWAAYHSPLRLADDHPSRTANTPRRRALETLEQAALARQEQEVERQRLLANLTHESMVELGREIVEGRGLCLNCHRIGRRGKGTQGPNLRDIGATAGSRVVGLSATAYLAQSLYAPDAFVVEGYAPSMTPVGVPPIGLDEMEVRMVVAYLETLGGTATMTPTTELEGAP